MSTDTATVLIGLLGLLVNIAFLGFLAIQVSLLKKQVADASEATLADRRRVQRQATVEFVASTLERRQQLTAKLPAESNRESVRRFLAESGTDRGKLQHVYDYLNYYEYFATAVNVGVFDAEIVARTSGKVITNIEEAYRPFVTKRREEQKQPSLYSELEQLAASMREWRRKQAAALREQADLPGAEAAG